MVNWKTLQNEVNAIRAGSENSILNGLKSNGSLLRINAIVSAVQNKVSSEQIISNIEKLQSDKTMVCGFLISDFAVAALDKLGVKKYTGDSDTIKAIIAEGIDNA